MRPLRRPAPLPVSTDLFTVLSTCVGAELVGLKYTPLFPYFQVRPFLPRDVSLQFIR